MINSELLSDLEKEILELLDNKAKDHYLADLSWASIPPLNQSREEITLDFFTKRYGKKYYDILPTNLKQKIRN